MKLYSQWKPTNTLTTEELGNCLIRKDAGRSGWQFIEIKINQNVLISFQPSHLKDCVLSDTVFGCGLPFTFHYSVSFPTLALHSQLSSFLIFFFLASTPDWKYFRSSLLHDISLKIIQVKLLAKESALEEHQLSRAGKVAW